MLVDVNLPIVAVIIAIAVRRKSDRKREIAGAIREKIVTTKNVRNGVMRGANVIAKMNGREPRFV